ncbi:unnamed protein product [Lampetra fluviatilis]
MLGTFEASDGVRMFAFSLTLLLLVVTVTANLLVLAIVAARTQLHVPMYVFMCNLLVADVVGGAVSFPQQLYVFLTGDLRISRASCIAQMFWINVFVDLESLTLAAMSVDRYVAICHPLRYHAVVTRRRALLAVVTTWLITVAIVIPQTLLVSRLELRATDREIQGIVCDFSGYIRLSASDTKVQEIFGSSTLVVFIALPLCVIAYTYFRIIRACKRTGQNEFKRKAVHTLLTHFLMLAMFFVACFVSTMVSRLTKDYQYSQIKNLRCGVQLIAFIIPIANVSIYLIRNNKIRKEMLKATMEGNKSFILLGTLEAPYGVQLLAFGLCLPLFVVTALSNLLVLGTVAVQRELHKPMYAFMCNLVLGDLIGCTVILPKQLHIFLTGDNEVSRASCVAQMFCMNVFICTECVTLTVMSVDRYVAICHPLHYHAIVTARRTLLVVVTAWSFTAALLVPLTILVVPLTLKDNDRQMPGIFCDYMGFIRLSADDTSVPEAYSSGMVALLFVLPLCVISVTYCKILLECKRTQVGEERAERTREEHPLRLAVRDLLHPDRERRHLLLQNPSAQEGGGDFASENVPE